MYWDMCSPGPGIRGQDGQPAGATTALFVALPPYVIICYHSAIVVGIGATSIVCNDPTLICKVTACLAPFSPPHCCRTSYSPCCLHLIKPHHNVPLHAPILPHACAQDISLDVLACT
jgi:hypothetical protein